MVKLPTSIDKVLRRLDHKLVLDLSQFSLDLIGIFDPTFLADGLNTVISLCRGDIFGAAVSAASMVPGGDLAKILKLERYVQTLKNLVQLAKKDILLRAGVKEMMSTFRTYLNKLPVSHPVVQKLKREVDEFFQLVIPPSNFPNIPALKHRSPELVKSDLLSSGFSKSAGSEVSYRPASMYGGAAGPKEIWSKFDPNSNGYFIVRMDTQGHAFKQDIGGHISIVAQTKSGVHLSHGGRPHYHKEWVPASEFQTFLTRPTPNSIKYDDLGEIAAELGPTHIPR